MNRFAGKVALVTIGASGIGAATARRLVAEGARVLITDIDASNGIAHARRLGAACRFAEHDVTNEAAWEAVCETAVGTFGALHVVVDSAGISVPSTIEAATLDHWRHTMAINADWVFLGNKHGVRTIKRFSAKSGGAIVNLASTLEARPGAAYVAYSASKAAVLAITRATAMHRAREKLATRVNAVLPGATHTRMVDTYLASYDADWVTGIALPVDGAYLAA